MINESEEEDCEMDDPEVKTSQEYMSNRGTGIVKKLTKERTIEMKQRRGLNLQIFGLSDAILDQ